VGSFIAAWAPDIGWVIVGRCLQGAGAISAAVIALTADLTRDSVRTRAMAVIGITIALTFAASLVAGPVLKALIGVPGIFALTGVLALGAMAVVHFAVPDPAQASPDRSIGRGQFVHVFRDTQLLRLNYGTFALHAALMALFTQIPFALRDNGPRRGAPLDRLSAGARPLDPGDDSVRSSQRTAPNAASCCSSAPSPYCWRRKLALAFSLQSLWALCIELTLFFRRAEPPRSHPAGAGLQMRAAEARGAAIGVNSSMQFLGAFAGAAAGGWLSEHVGGASVFILGVALTGMWLIATATMAAPRTRFATNYPMGEVRWPQSTR
jgi:predicted MFS family arabinose efflux permease